MFLSDMGELFRIRKAAVCHPTPDKENAEASALKYLPDGHHHVDAAALAVREGVLLLLPAGDRPGAGVFGDAAPCGYPHLPDASVNPLAANLEPLVERRRSVARWYGRAASLDCRDHAFPYASMSGY
jgi:hypothetical protein